MKTHTQSYVIAMTEQVSVQISDSATPHQIALALDSALHDLMIKRGIFKFSAKAEGSQAVSTSK